MNIDFYDAGKLKIGIVDCMIKKCTKNITGISPTPATEEFFADGKGNPNYKAA